MGGFRLVSLRIPMLSIRPSSGLDLLILRRYMRMEAGDHPTDLNARAARTTRHSRSRQPYGRRRLTMSFNQRRPILEVCTKEWQGENAG